MRSARNRLLICALLIAAGCSKTPTLKRTEYHLQTSCSGGGGLETCVARNEGDDRLEPFNLEVEFWDDRGSSIGRSLVQNDQGLDPKGEWRFNLTGPPRTRSIRFGRVTPRGAQ
jgi:hypothetical protein